MKKTFSENELKNYIKGVIRESISEANITKTSQLTDAENQQLIEMFSDKIVEYTLSKFDLSTQKSLGKRGGEMLTMQDDNGQEIKKTMGKAISELVKIQKYARTKGDPNYIDKALEKGIEMGVVNFSAYPEELLQMLRGSFISNNPFDDDEDDNDDDDDNDLTDNDNNDKNDFDLYGLVESEDAAKTRGGNNRKEYKTNSFDSSTMFKFETGFNVTLNGFIYYLGGPEKKVANHIRNWGRQLFITVNKDGSDLTIHNADDELLLVRIPEDGGRKEVVSGLNYELLKETVKRKFEAASAK